jgi:cysteinyl-tRNA synthetase
MSKKKELFQPRPDQGNAVSMYVCGVTVYDYSHIGHARAYVAFDILYRTLTSLGYKVTYVRNFTDVDDKIIARATVTQEDPLALAARFADEFRVDMKSLNCLPPTLEPRATEYIPQMIDMIQDIINNGHAYVAGSDNNSRDVFFDVESLPGYGRLSGRSLEDNRAGERVAVDDRKKGPADFALWKSAKPGEPTWDSPWGPGRPGWHIECSAMIKNVLGSVIDIHGGGRDLVFPHHENELAQSRAAEGPCGCGSDHHHSSSGPAFVRYWMHNGFVNVDSEKMSKSLGNFFTIRDVIQQYHPLALRWFLVNTQYRQPVNYTQRALEEASDRLYYLYQTVLDINGVVEGGGNREVEEIKGKGRWAGAEEMVAEARVALVDDLNTPSVVASLSAPLKAINDLIHTKKGKKAPGRMVELVGYQSAVQEVLELLGLWTESGPEEVLEEMRELALKRSGLSDSEVEAAIEERATARGAKDFAAADAVREKLEKCGIAIMDTPAGTMWRPTVKSE